MKKRFVGLGALLGIAGATLIQLPLSWIGPHVLPQEMGKNIRYSGTIWKGHISGVDIIGDIYFNVDAKALLSRQLPLSFQTSSSAMTMSGKSSKNRLKDFKFSGQLADLPTSDGRLKEIAGHVDFQISQMDFDENCKAAAGNAATDILTRNGGRWQWRGPFLSGPISCDQGDLIVKLSGSENAQTIKADLRIKIDGAYRAVFSVRTREAAAGVVLPLYGFDIRNGHYYLTEEGKWR